MMKANGLLTVFSNQKNNGILPCLQGGRQIGIWFSAMVFLPYRRILQSRKCVDCVNMNCWSFSPSTDRPKTNLGYLWVTQLIFSDSTKLDKAENWRGTMSCSIVLTAYFFCGYWQAVGVVADVGCIEHWPWWTWVHLPLFRLYWYVNVFTYVLRGKTRQQ